MLMKNMASAPKIKATQIHLAKSLLKEEPKVEKKVAKKKKAAKKKSED